MAKQAGNRLGDERRKREWKQEDLAAASGISVPMISRYETGAAFPQPDNIDKLAAAFEVAADEIFRWLREPSEGAAA